VIEEKILTKKLPMGKEVTNSQCAVLQKVKENIKEL